jgi:hypothetical protein
MLDTAELLQTYEQCERRSFWSQQWEKNKLMPTRALEDSIRIGLEYDGEDWGEEAGSRIFEIAATRGLDSDEYDQHSEATHLACLADVIATATRKKGDKPWVHPDPVEGWSSSCYLSPDGGSLRRVIPVSSWSDERHDSICRSWTTLGPVAFHDLPMKIAVAVIGNRKGGRWHSFWSHALQHPQNRKLRFRKRNNIGEPFKTSWLECWRADHDELDALTWINAMAEDQVLQDVFFLIDFPRMEEVSRNRVMDVAKRKMERIQNTKMLPDEIYSGCSFPIRCQFLGCCTRGDSPNGRSGFISVDQITFANSPK